MTTGLIGGLSNNGAVPQSGFLSKPANPLQSVANSLKNKQTSGLSIGSISPEMLGQKTTQSGGLVGNTGSINIPIGNNPGLIQKPQPTTPIKSTTDTAGNVTTYHAPKADEGVRAQQKALNKLGAGLAEDGVIGPKTREAIAKYGTGSTPPPPPTGNTTESIKIPETTKSYSQEEYDKAIADAKGTNPQVGSARENAQNVLNAGQMTPQEQAANEEVAKANELQKSYQNVGTLSPYAEASLYSGRARTPEEIQNIQQAPDLAGRASSTNGLTNSLSNIYGSSRVAGANAALQGIQTAAGRGLSAAGTVLGASLPGQISGSTRTYNPLDPTGTSTIESGVNNQSKYDLLNQYNTGKATLAQAQGIENQISNTILNNPDINNQPISLLTNLNQYLSGQIGSAPQQLLAQQVSNYIKTLGLDPASVVNIATQQKGTLKQILKSLKDTATNNNEALKKTADSLGTSNTSGGSAGGIFNW